MAHGFGIPAIRPRFEAIATAAPTIAREDVEQYVASTIGSPTGDVSVRLVDFRWGAVSEIQAMLAPEAPRLIDMPRLICMARLRGNFSVNEPGGRRVPASRMDLILMD
jgi:hypothetical protein